MPVGVYVCVLFSVKLAFLLLLRLALFPAYSSARQIRFYILYAISQFVDVF